MDLSDLEGKSIRVSNINYSIIVKKKIKKGEYLGRTFHNEAQIHLSLDQSEKSLIDTLLHEILHCIWYTRSIETVKDSDHFEEFAVTNITNALISVFQDNPWLLDVLKKG